MKKLEDKWTEYFNHLDIAFQAIVNVDSGKLYAVEALLRGTEDIGFSSIAEFFDKAYADNILYTVDLILREKVIKKFTLLSDHKKIKLFINVDNRLLEMPNFRSGNTARILDKYNLDQNIICFEISERHAISNIALFEKTLQHYRQENYSIAVDDFGVGVSGYQMLYRTIPDIIKIDRFFFESICTDNKKKILVKSIAQLAIQFGIKVIAEGVETYSEMLIAKALGCHLVQGYYVQKPSLNTDDILSEYESIKALAMPYIPLNMHYDFYEQANV